MDVVRSIFWFTVHHLNNILKEVEVMEQLGFAKNFEFIPDSINSLVKGISKTEHQIKILRQYVK